MVKSCGIVGFASTSSSNVESPKLADLNSLRYNCYLSFFSVLLILVTITYKSLAVNLADPSRLNSETVMLTTHSWSSATFSFPLVALAFLSQFNMLSVHASLTDPTRSRLLSVINASTGICTVLFLVFGVAGYLYALGDTRDNILLNFEGDNGVPIRAGKVGLGTAIMAGECCCVTTRVIYRFRGARSVATMRLAKARAKRDKRRCAL